jgi:hypothetical protein
LDPYDWTHKIAKPFDTVNMMASTNYSRHTKRTARRSSELFQSGVAQTTNRLSGVVLIGNIASVTVTLDMKRTLA